ncbi:hypothetical protein ACBR40_13560 [Nonomuraea sp. AD125B]|uniref:hypothetical protein n=1 Tax=Nonomuraea sp. AD125B TaxID=3242897 RepID=UPI0035281CA6
MRTIGPLQVFGDAAYATAELRASLTTAGHRPLIKPSALTPTVNGGFTVDDFAIDTATGTVTCPAGRTFPLAAPAGRYQQRRATFTGVCAACATAAPPPTTAGSTGVQPRTARRRGASQGVQRALLGRFADGVDRHPVHAVLLGRLALGGLPGEHLDDHLVLHRRASNLPIRGTSGFADALNSCMVTDTFV